MQRTIARSLILVSLLVVGLAAGPGLAGAHQASPTSEVSKDLDRRHTEAFAAGDLSTLQALTASDFVDGTVGPGGDPSRAGLIELSRTFHAAFPDLTVTIEDQVAEGDQVASRLTFHGKQTGEFFGVPPSGNTIEVTGIHILRIADGKVVAHWGVLDRLTLLQQIGALPPPGASAVATPAA